MLLKILAITQKSTLAEFFGSCVFVPLWWALAMSLPSNIANGIQMQYLSCVVTFGAAENKNSHTATVTKYKLCYWEAYFQDLVALYKEETFSSTVSVFLLFVCDGDCICNNARTWCKQAKTSVLIPFLFPGDFC